MPHFYTIQSQLKDIYYSYILIKTYWEMEGKNSACLNSTIGKKKSWLENQINYLFFIRPLYVHFLCKMNLNYFYTKKKGI